MTEPVLPELAPAPSFAPQRRRKVAEPNPYDAVIAELAAARDEAGFSESRIASVGDIDAARKTRSQVRKAAKTAGVTSKVKFAVSSAGTVDVRFGIVPKKAKPADAEAEAAPGVSEPAPGPIDSQVDF